MDPGSCYAGGKPITVSPEVASPAGTKRDDIDVAADRRMEVSTAARGDFGNSDEADERSPAIGTEERTVDGHRSVRAGRGGWEGKREEAVCVRRLDRAPKVGAPAPQDTLVVVCDDMGIVGAWEVERLEFTGKRYGPQTEEYLAAAARVFVLRDLHLS